MPNTQFCLLHLPPLLKIPRPRGDDHKMHEIAVVGAATVDAAAAADRLVEEAIGGVHRSSWSKDR